MRSQQIAEGQNAVAQQFINLRHDARGAGHLLVHQQLGALALGTAPTNGQTVTLTINGTGIVFTAVGTIGSAAGNVFNPGTAAGFVANIVALILQPQTTTATGVALSAANQQLLSYLSWPTFGTTITPCSNNTSLYAPLTSFTVSTTVTSGTYTAQTMQLYIEPGVVYVGGTRVIFNGASTPTVTAPSANPRIDVLSVDSSGTLAWTTGTENASPVAPAYPANKVALCELYNVVSETALYDIDNQHTGQGYILNDVRPTLGSSVNLLAVASNVIADADATRDLGASGTRWNNLYAATLHGDGSNLTGITSASQTGINATFDEAASAGQAVAIWEGEQTTVSIGSLTNVNADLLTTFPYFAMKFTAPSGVPNIASATFCYTQAGGGAQSLGGTVSLQADSAGSPSGTSVGSTTFSSSTSGGGNQPVTATFASPVVLTGGASYWVVVQVTSGAQSNDFIGGESSNPFTTKKSPDGITWSNASNSSTIGYVYTPFTSGHAVLASSSSASSSRYKGYVGIANAAVLKGASGFVAIIGVITGLTSLTTGSTYFLNDTNGAIGTSAGSTSLKIGRALLATELLVQIGTF